MTRTRRLLVVLGAGAAVATVAVAPALTQSTSTRVRTVYIARSVHSLPQTPFVRTRDCLRRPRSCVNGVGGLELVYLIRGRMPTKATTATVLTDTGCAADRNGISHCSNILRLASGRRITVRHDHSMMNDPCLFRREHVLVRALR
jgi:hypothetical protein